MDKASDISRTTTAIKPRMLRAAKLDSTLFDELKDDDSATRQALVVILISVMASGIGQGIVGSLKEGVSWLLWYLFFGVGVALLGWVTFSFFIYFLSTRFFGAARASVTYKKILRAIGFSNSPATIGISLFIPYLSNIILAIIFLWTSLVGIIATRQTMQFTTGRAVAVFIISHILWMTVITAPLFIGFILLKT